MVEQRSPKPCVDGSKPSSGAIAKLIADGVITQDADGTIRMTEKSWRLMTMQPTK